MEAFFFSTEADVRLLGIWRGPSAAPRVWVLCPPFAEEEKSARRVLTLIAQALEQKGEASLLFSFRGTADSEGDFGQSNLSRWRRDLQAACEEAKRRAPHATLALLGVRLGASLALQESQHLEAKNLVLLEPLLSGRSFLMQQNAKKQIRAQMTGEAAAAPEVAPSDSKTQDLDGWELGASMKVELSALDLRSASPTTAQTAIFQIGPRAEVAPPLQNLASQLDATAYAVVMPPFWNLIDYANPAPLLDKIAEVWDG